MAEVRKTRKVANTPKLYSVRKVTASSPQESSNDTVGQELVRRLRAAAAYTVGDQAPPVAILWPDGEKRWISVLTELKTVIPELYSLGAIAPADRSGPAIWLRCIEARTIEPKPSTGQTPIFYLPGISRQDLRSVEECPSELEPLIELQFRGAVWSRPNGKDWTPLFFLTSAQGGLGLEVLGDSDTAVALDRSLAVLLNEKITDLSGQKLDAQYFNMLLTPDLPIEILRWMNDPAAARKRKTEPEWKAFCAQSLADYRLHPEKDGELCAAKSLGNRAGGWGKVWKRFAEAPTKYPGVVALLEKAAPKKDGMLPLDREFWPTYNAEDEAALAKVLLELKD